MTVVLATYAEVIFIVKVILYRQLMVFVSLVIHLIGQLTFHVIATVHMNGVALPGVARLPILKQQDFNKEIRHEPRSW